MTTNMFKTNAYKRENSAKIHARAVLRHVEQIAAEKLEKQVAEESPCTCSIDPQNPAQHA